MKTSLKLLLALLLIMPVATYAQSSGTFGITYSVGLTSGDFNDYISDESWRGVSLDYRRLIKENIQVGMTSGWNIFYEEKPAGIYTSGNVSYTGKQFRYGNVIPIVLVADYVKQPETGLGYMIGLGAGISWAEKKVDVGVIGVYDDGWPFTLMPEVGIIYGLNSNLNLTLGARYYWLFDSGEVGEMPYYTFNAGLSWGF